MKKCRNFIGGPGRFLNTQNVERYRYSWLRQKIIFLAAFKEEGNSFYFVPDNKLLLEPKADPFSIPPIPMGERLSLTSKPHPRIMTKSNMLLLLLLLLQA